MARIVRISQVKPGGFFAIPDIDDLKRKDVSLVGRHLFRRGHYDRSLRKYFYTSCADIFFTSFMPSNTLVIVK